MGQHLLTCVFPVVQVRESHQQGLVLAQSRSAQDKNPGDQAGCARDMPGRVLSHGAHSGC